MQHRERLISLDGWIYFQVRERFCMHVLFHWLSMLGWWLPALHWSPHWQEHWGITKWFVKLWDNSVICFNSHQAPVRIGVIFKHLRKLMDSLLERKLANPKMNLEGNFNRTSNWLLNEWIVIFIVSQYIYTHTFSNSLSTHPWYRLSFLSSSDEKTIQIITELIKSENMPWGSACLYSTMNWLWIKCWQTSPRGETVNYIAKL